MFFATFAAALLAVATASPAKKPPPTGPTKYGYFINNTIEATGGHLSFSYPRFTQLKDGTILATAAQGGAGSPAYFPIHKSTDGGATWTHISNLTDQVNGWGLGSQPAITYLETAMGGYAAGTILATGNSASANGTRLDLYASTDGAMTWKFVSLMAQGGRPNTTNGATPIWEPRLLQYKGVMGIFYSDQRDPLHGQKLSHQESKDLVNWGPVINDVALSPYVARPGMTNIAYIKPIKKWMLVHETPVGNISYYGIFYPVHYVMADSPFEFGQNPDIPLVVNNQVAPNASPYVAWTPVGGPMGTILVSDADHMQVFTNTKGGDVNSWEMHATPAGAVYSRAIQIFNGKPNHLMIYGGNVYAAPVNLPFTATVVKVTDVLASGNGTTWTFPPYQHDDE